MKLNIDGEPTELDMDDSACGVRLAALGCCFCICTLGLSWVPMCCWCSTMESKYQRARVRAENERATNYPQQDNNVGAGEDDNQGSRFRIQIHENNNNRDNEQYTFTISIQSASNEDDGAAMPPHTPTNNTNNAESNTYTNNYNTYSPTTGGEQRGPVCEGIHLPDEQEHIG